jgi:hypothetical protein
MMDNIYDLHDESAKQLSKCRDPKNAYHYNATFLVNRFLKNNV